MEVVAKENKVTILDHDLGTMVEKIVDDPMTIPRSISEGWRPQLIQDLPEALCGGWVGFFSYDTVWYVEKKKLPFSNAPKDDRNLADIHLGLYDDVIVFDHVDKLFTDVAPKTAENFRALCTGEKGAALKLGSHFTIKEPFLIALSKDTWLRADDHDCMSCDIVLRQGTCFGKTVTMEKAYTVGSFQCKTAALLCIFLTPGAKDRVSSKGVLPRTFILQMEFKIEQQQGPSLHPQ